MPALLEQNRDILLRLRGIGWLIVSRVHQRFRSARHDAVRSHSWRVPSDPPESALRPSGENATEFTARECPLNVRSSLPVATSHSLTQLSQLPDSALRPSGENATVSTTPEWPLKARRSL